MKATARPSPSAITQALVPYPPRDRPRASQRSRSAEEPPFERHRLLSGGPGCWCRPETSSRVEPRALGRGPALLGEEQQALPHAQARPAEEGLSRPRPGTKLSRDGAPLGAVLMPPDDGRDRAPQILGRGLALGPAGLDQRLQPRPLRVRQHGPSSSKRGKTPVIPTGSSANRP